MPFYQFQIQGKNFLVQFDGRTEKHGFLTVRYVEADDPRSGELLAIQSIRQKDSVREVVRNSQDDPPTMHVTNLVELESFDGIETVDMGLIWFPENPRRWWEFWKR